VRKCHKHFFRASHKNFLSARDKLQVKVHIGWSKVYGREVRWIFWHKGILKALEECSTTKGYRRCLKNVLPQRDTEGAWRMFHHRGILKEPKECSATEGYWRSLKNVPPQRDTEGACQIQKLRKRKSKPTIVPAKVIPLRPQKASSSRRKGDDQFQSPPTLSKDSKTQKVNWMISLIENEIILLL
jgi:hypothetical protein